jgi:hypothetical protein
MIKVISDKKLNQFSIKNSLNKSTQTSTQEINTNKETNPPTSISMLKAVTKQCATRKNCEYPITELLAGAVHGMLVDKKPFITLNHVIQYSQDQAKLEKDKKTLICDNTENYIKDLENKEKQCTTFIENLYSEIQKKFTPEKHSSIKQVFITGKKSKNENINQLNKNLGKAAKADIYFKMADGTYEGLSIKQSKNATKSNYSVEKCFKKEERQNCKTIKLNHLKDNNAPNPKPLSGQEKKDARKKCNQLFYVDNPTENTNPYWQAIKDGIDSNKDKIQNMLVASLLCDKIPYPMSEFDGEKIEFLNKLKYSNDNIKFEEEPSYYYNKKNELRKTAKLFYKLTFAYTTPDTAISINNTKTYRVEIRWKGDIKNASPQFQMHEE